MIAALLAAAAAAADPCALPASAGNPQPAEAEAYLEVAESERRSGATTTALAAFREAFRLDPASDRARRGFLTACLQDDAPVTLARGRKLMDDGDRAAAIALFEQLRAGRTDAPAALLEGICRFEDGDDEQARPLLREAEASPALEGRARYFLGLIELRHGEGAAAAGDFQRAAQSPEPWLAERAAVLLAPARRTGHAVLSAFAESGYDSNVTYSPDGSPASADGAGGAGAAVVVRPLGLSGPYLRASGFYRAQLQVPGRNLGVFSGQAGYRLGIGETHAFGEYAYEATTLGGLQYLSAHRLRAGGRVRRGHFVASASYAAHFDTYFSALGSRYSGTLHAVDAAASWRFPQGSSVGLGYQLDRDATSFVDTSALIHGPRLFAELYATPTLRLSAEASLLGRGFDGSLDGSETRSDRIVGFGGAVEKDLFDRFTLRLSAADRIVRSNKPESTYSRVTLLLGLSYTVGLF